MHIESNTFNGNVFIGVCIDCSAYKNLPEHKKKLYNKHIHTNKTLKQPFAHGGVGRSKCGICTCPEKSGKYKRKQRKHEFNNVLKSIDL
jgi:hypothetical protein